MRWEVFTGIFLVALTGVLTAVHNAVFKDPKTLYFYLMEDIVFLPVQVLLVSLVIEGFLSLREKRAMLEKLNMVIEVFFSEVGNTLLKHLLEFDSHKSELCCDFKNISEWTPRDFDHSQRKIKTFEFQIGCPARDLDYLRDFLMGKRNFMLRLLENPNLLEHETFTKLLWAVFHLMEELAHRKNCRDLSEADRKHFMVDIQRAYALLLYEWVGYMKHLKNDYPYLFSLAARVSPFNPEGRAEFCD